MERSTAAVTLKHVAEAAGVSITTASLVLNGGFEGRVGVAAQNRVRLAAKQLGYTVNSMAKALRTRRSRTVGFVSDRITTTPFAVRMVHAAQEEAWRRGILLFLVNTDGDEELERSVIDELRQRQVEGIIYARVSHRVVEPPPGLGRQAVLLNARTTHNELPSVVPDEYQGAMDATTRLIDAGHRRIGFLFPGSSSPAGELRLRGYRDALGRNGLSFDPALVAIAPRTISGSAKVAEEFLQAQRPTATFCYNDRIAAGAYRAAANLGMRVPFDLSVVGFDDQLYLASALTPGLTTMALPYEEMGRWAVQALFDLLDGRNDATTFEPRLAHCRLLERDSVAAPARD
jgi:LacI family transcriptional regulator